MKRVIEVEDLCCKRCAERAEKKLLLLDGVSGAKANFKKNIIFVEAEIPDDEASVTQGFPKKIAKASFFGKRSGNAKSSRLPQADG